jgi:hypothetical protein
MCCSIEAHYFLLFRIGFPELMSAVGMMNIIYSPLLLILGKVAKPDPERNVR